MTKIPFNPSLLKSKKVVVVKYVEEREFDVVFIHISENKNHRPIFIEYKDGDVFFSRILSRGQAAIELIMYIED